mmetsp:Transcript_90534/g.132411  ORF Transcript_90534/g.132411 Transcript_90534/m.132411 type:complete len:116 (-) Transcript_90534:1545-1892(-)
MMPVYTKTKNNCKRRPNTYLEKVNSDLFSHLYVKPMQPKFLEDLYAATNKESLQMLQALSLLLRLKIAIPKHLARRISQIIFGRGPWNAGVFPCQEFAAHSRAMFGNAIIEKACM